MNVFTKNTPASTTKDKCGLLTRREIILILYREKFGQMLHNNGRLNIQAKQAVLCLKRHHPYSIKRTDDLPAKKPRPPVALKNILEALKAKHPHLQVAGCRVQGSTHALEVVVPKTFKAIVVLKYGVSIDQVLIRGIHESSLLERKEDISSQSNHTVFQKLTEYANCAVLHYYSSTEPFQQILGVMRWLDSCHSMFARKCTKCEMHLKEEAESMPLPPCWKAYDTLLPYHFSCRP